MTGSATAIETSSSPNPSAMPRKAAWEVYGIKLLAGKSLNRAGHIAVACSAVDSLSWLYHERKLGVDDDYKQDLRAMRVGLYELGRLAGLTDPELEARGVVDDEVRKERSELEEIARNHRPGFIRRVTSSLWD